MEKKKFSLAKTTALLHAVQKMHDIKCDIDTTEKEIANILAHGADVELPFPFKVKSANEWIEEASKRPLNLNDVHEAYKKMFDKRSASFNAWHGSKRRLADYRVGFLEGWQAAIEVFDELNPEFFKWLSDLK